MLVKRILTGFLALTLFVEFLGAAFLIALFTPLVANAALVVIEGSPNTTSAVHTQAGASTVFISDLVGYKFYRTAAGACVYRKTLNSGATWGTPVTVDSQTDCVATSVWYDRWTPGDTTGNFIHIATIDEGNDDIWYNRLDTSTDTLLLAGGAAISVFTGSAATYVAATNRVSITKATNGTVYVNADDGNGTVIRRCTTSCNLTASWTAVGTAPQGNADSWSLLAPLASGNVLLVNRSTGGVIQSSFWNGSIWSGLTTIDAAAEVNTTYDVGMALTVDVSNNDVHLAWVAQHNALGLLQTSDNDIRTASYTGGGWTMKTDVVTNISGGLHQVAIARDQNNGRLYVAYSHRITMGTAASAQIKYKVSTNGMTSWGAELGPLSGAASAEIYGIDMNIMSFQKLYVSWYSPGATDIIGETVVDTGPEVELRSFGTQNAIMRASSTNYYIGGGFALSTRNVTKTVTSFTISETGTVNAQNDLRNIRLFYDLDTTAPYNCASESYAGTESAFGGIVLNGFSGADGTASFTGSVNITPTATMCVYTVLDIRPTAPDSVLLDVQVTSPDTQVVVSGSDLVFPTTAVALPGSTTIVDSNLTQTGYHWRNDNGTETTATSATGGAENTPLGALQKGAPRRLRVAISNEGSTTTLAATSYRLEYGEAAPNCTDVSTWEAVGPSAVWSMSPSANITDGANTTNIAIGTGGITDAGTTFLTPNAALRDTTNITGSGNIPVNNFVEAEFSIVASSTALEGTTYCFRITQSGAPLKSYLQYGMVTIAADVTVGGLGTQITTVTAGQSNVYAGGAFTIIERTAARTVTSVTLSELGTVNATSGLSNIRLFYDSDVSAPYNCSSESYAGTEAQYGATSVGGFTGSNETVTFSGSVGISPTSALCLYVVYNVTVQAQNNQTFDVAIATAPTDVVTSGSPSIGPSGQVDITGSTTIQGAVLTQLAYHWRNDDGTETGATSATGGVQNSPITDFPINSPIRLRFSVTNLGAVANVPVRFRLEYAPRITTCDAASVWTDVNAAPDGWNMFNSASLTNGETTTNIAIANGGVTDGTGTFIAANGGVRDTESRSATTTIPSTNYLDLEYSITSTSITPLSTTFCFRVSADGTALNGYNNYAEVEMSAKRDFKIQRGSTQVAGTGITLTAGVNYTAPASTSLAFVRITNSHYTGAGNNTATAGQNADDVTAHISNPGNLATSFTITRPPAATSNTRVDWEIIEFIGQAGTDNEIRVRNVGVINVNATDLQVSGASVPSVVNDSQVVVFITGAGNRDAVRDFYASQFTSEWDATTNTPIFRRTANGATAADISYAVVEFVGLNWNIQRVEHTFAAAGVTETESITAVNSLERTFIHSQRRVGANTNVLNYGHEAWLSSIGAVSFQLETGASVAIGQVSVAWVIENTQTGLGAMMVQRSNGTTNGGTGPLTVTISLSSPIDALNNTSISATTRAAGANTTFPRPIAGFTINSTTTYQLWRSETGAVLAYRAEIIEWPVANLAIRQNYYRFYVDNNALTPNDPWPPGPSDLGENSSITTNNEPLGDGDVVRLRMTLLTTNATMLAGFTDFKLQYGLRATTCSAVSEGAWTDLGADGSGEIWRGYAATGTTDGTPLSTNPPTPGDLLISLADRAGSLVHDNPSLANPYIVQEGDDIEYDWYIQHNGAVAENTYCFRVLRADGSKLEGYNNYPQIRTAGYLAANRSWRWYDDIENQTPTQPLAALNVAPIEIANNDTIALRIAIAEVNGITGQNIKFKLQYSEDAAFMTAFDVVATSSCQANSVWCYVQGAGINNATITTRTIGEASTCTGGVGAGCGTHNVGALPASGHTHGAGVTQEYSFTIKQAEAGNGKVYYFRVFNVTSNTPAEPVSGSTYPSLVTETSLLELSIVGLQAGTTTAGVVTNASTSASSIDFGDLILDTEKIAAHRITVETNALDGYQLFTYARQQLLNSGGNAIPAVNATNNTPAPWTTACSASSTGCVGYHTTDPTLASGSTRFALDDRYAALETSPVEVMYSSVPTTDVHDIVYRIRVNQLQPAGDYETEIVYIAVPSF